MEENKGIYRKIMRVMEKVEYLAKDDTISYGDKVKYKGLSEEKVTRVIRKELVEQGIIVYPIHQEHKREGNLSTVDVTYRFVDVEDGSYIDAVSSGTGADTQDKGVGKAMTYAYKYLWLRTFAIPTGEDPDKISSAELDDKEKAHRVAKGKTSILQLLEDNPDLNDDFKTATISDVDIAVGKDDVDTLAIIYKETKAEIRRMRAPEIRAESKESFAKAAKSQAELDAMAYNEEPPLPDSDTKQTEIF